MSINKKHKKVTKVKKYIRSLITTKKVTVNLFQYGEFNNTEFNDQLACCYCGYLDCPSISQCCGSDKKLKKNFETISGVLDKLKYIHAYQFEWKDPSRSKNPFQKKQIGVVAQEVEKIFPELVTLSNNRKYKMVNYLMFSAILIQAVNELKILNEKLIKRVYLLESRILKQTP
ncbi:hypothetical protein A2960_04670 [Candidatus Gottesmanbacteria bacterium RIFCSPLOWO2_01_FULL_39_12b]|uniref:Peptidase S74 domain-containing protein n=1 Tax=Candidatus Gottesmanbacteria bacterium RIFCSPLOWO2_01_FULL_39_12b TaxID=1798388 RepID=A0A1F6AP13_9BACT|nr:MAG: hypothetical protein A2960_04670 [Candidatus Gottesmanbacteria bacterium RIFCSPLOWO2_01_FULL_39_12b]